MSEDTRCQGFRRHGGALTFGPPVWEQCENEGVVMLTVLQDGEKETLPACNECWQECIDRGVKIEKVAPIVKSKEEKA